MSALDLQVQARTLRATSVGMRVANIYDINAKCILLKLAASAAWRPGGYENGTSTGDELAVAASDALQEDGSARKTIVVIESGVRIHTSRFERDKGARPSNFAAKLRKHLRGQRLQDVQQVGSDRVLQLTFGYGNHTALLFLEFYAGGNIVLTDERLTILSLLRPYTSPDGVAVRVRSTYPVTSSGAPGRMEATRFRDVLASVVASAVAVRAEAGPGGPNSKVRRKMQVCRLLADAACYGPQLVEHALLSAGWGVNASADEEIEKRTAEEKDALLHALQQVDSMILDREGAVSEGFIWTRPSTTGATNEAGEAAVEYYDFSPLLLKQYAGTSHVALPSFDVAVDDYFSVLERERAATSETKAKQSATKRVGKVEREFKDRSQLLRDEQDDCGRMAMAVEANAGAVDTAVAMVREQVHRLRDWTAINAALAEMRENGDPSALLVDSLLLEKRQVVLRLPAFDDDEADTTHQEAEVPAPGVAASGEVLVPVGLDQSGMASAREFHQQRKKAASKEARTQEAESTSMKKARAKADRSAREAARKQAEAPLGIREGRKRVWFEKFFWFVSSDRCVVVAGKDAHQNELLVKRYMRSQDVYVHADVHGAATVIIRNDAGGAVPPRTIEEAASFAVCRSKAWKAKLAGGTQAWWVHPSQVSKTPQAGEYLTTGSFVIRGKKNFVPLQIMMQMGFGIMFRRKAFDELEDALPVGSHAEEGEEGEEGGGDAPEVGKGGIAREGAAEVSGGGDSSELGGGDGEDGGWEEEGGVETLVEDVEGMSLACADAGDARGEGESEEERGDECAQDSGEESGEDGRGEGRLEEMAGGNDEQPDEGAPENGAKHGKEPEGGDEMGDEEGEEEEEEEDEGEGGQGPKGSEEVLRLLTGSPKASDPLIFAMGVCGPFSALEGCRYRVKLLPGSGKRSGTLSAALNYFEKEARGLEAESVAAANAADGKQRAKELQLIKALPDAEVLPVLLGDARVVADLLGRAGTGSKGGASKAYRKKGGKQRPPKKR
ncbi:hypothetical protein T484DRAFT_2017782 [Baffinella frigidus]|nr:hypothetical protein T484DRAFT_2017782 [Cryptophyta sp. CCMP2293]